MMRFAFTLLGGFLAVAAITPHVAPQSRGEEPEEQGVRGARIHGTVVDMDGRPVAGVRVGLSGDSKYPWRVHTDQQGRFTLIVPTPGNYRVIADKREAGYADTYLLFNHAGTGIALPRVTTYGEETIENLVVSLGPKQSRLVVCVHDAASGKAVEGVYCKLTRPNDATAWVSQGGQAIDGRPGCYEVLVPPSTPFEIEVSAQGYRTWRYGAGENAKAPSQSLEVDRGTSRELEITLQQQE